MKRKQLEKVIVGMCFTSMLAVIVCGSSSAVASTVAKKSEAAQTTSNGVTMKGDGSTVNAADFDTNVTPNGDYTIAVVVKSAAIPVWESHIIAARKAGEDLGVEILDYSPTKADNVEEQKRILEDLITTGVDAVVLAPANTEAVEGPVQDLIDAGIPVIYDNTMGPSNVDYLTYVGIDNELCGAMIAEQMAEKIGGKGKMVIMEGVPGQSTSDIRKEGALNKLGEYPDIEVESAVTNWQSDEGRKVAEDYITKWGNDLSALVAIGGNQAEGAVEAVKAANMQDIVKVSGFDVQEPQYTAVKNGDEVFTVSQGVYYQAYYSVVAAVKALNGETVPSNINCPITIVTQDNLDEMDERPDAIQNK